MDTVRNVEKPDKSKAASERTFDKFTAPPGLPSERTFGAILRAIRERLGLTQPQFAALMGQSTSYVSLLESNQRRPTERVLTNVKSSIELTADEEAALTDAASIPDPMTQLVQYAVSTLGARAGADAFQRVLLREDLTRIFHAYTGLLQGMQHLNANKFQMAHDQFERIVIGPEAAALPALIRANAAVALTDVALKQGEPKSAETAISEAKKLLAEVLPSSALPLHAEAEAMQGMIELRAGRYPEATAKLTNALKMYQEMATEPREQTVTAVGLTKSYNRLALLAMLQGDPTSAQSYCKSALDTLKVISPDENDLSDPRRARLLALQAWACAEDGDFKEARRLRERVSDAYEASHDAYGLAKTRLYMADDAKHELQANVELGDEALASASTRLETYHKRLDTPAMRRLIQCAMEDYSKAAEELKKLGEALLLSRAYRGIGDMHRYAALLDPAVASQEIAASRRNLQLARDLESRANQERLLPGTQESLARLEWDEDHLAPARDLFTEAIANLSVNATPGDRAAAMQLRRYTLGLQQVKAALLARSAQNMQAIGKAPPTLHGLTARWRDLSTRIAHALAEAIERNNAAPESISSLTLHWTQRLLDLDQQPGARLVAQGTLSTSHEQSPLASKGLRRFGIEAESDYTASLHAARFHATDFRIREAHEHPERGGAYIDICVRDTVEGGVARDEHARIRATEALRRLRDWSRGYQLIVVEEPMPIHFILKGDVALIELTYEAGALEPRLRDICNDPNSESCIPFHDAKLVAALRDIATEMRQIANQKGHDADWAIAWLSSLVEVSAEAMDADITAVPAF